MGLIKQGKADMPDRTKPGNESRDFVAEDWPDDFDFETDEICQTVFKPYILEKMEELADFDAQRPADTKYIFHEHSERVAEDVRNTCLHLGLSEHVANNIYWATLIHDMGKMQLPVDIWDSEEKPTDDLKQHRRTHTTLGRTQFEKDFEGVEHPFKDLAIDIMDNHHEQMDGLGTHGLSAENISPATRIASIVEAFDGWSIPRPHFGDRDISPPSVLQRMKDEKSHMFDEDMLQAFTEVKMAQYVQSLYMSRDVTGEAPTL